MKLFLEGKGLPNQPSGNTIMHHLPTIAHGIRAIAMSATPCPDCDDRYPKSGGPQSRLPGMPKHQVQCAEADPRLRCEPVRLRSQPIAHTSLPGSRSPAIRYGVCRGVGAVLHHGGAVGYNSGRWGTT